MAEPNPLRAWGDAPVFVLSCPGPLRPHHAAITPVSQLVLPQCLLGFEAQLAAFAAAFPALAPRMVFTPLPAAFDHPESLAALAPWLDGGEGRPVHLRFGGPRVGRIMKPALNGAVIAEEPRVFPVTTSQHPFAGGLTLPAAVRRVFTYAAGGAAFATTAGDALPATLLPAACITADIEAGRQEAARGPEGHSGIDLVSFAEYRSNQWASGPVRANSAHLRAAMRLAADDGAPFVLLPWNLDDPGSIVPELLVRLAALQSAARPVVRPLVLPFNYPGQLGLLRRLIARVRNAAADPDAMLQSLFIARLTRFSALPLLLRLAAIAWVDGNDPEHRWSLRRLAACGIATILLDPGASGGAATLRVRAEESVWVEADTRWGRLGLKSGMPSRRDFPLLLAATESCRTALAEPALSARRGAR